MKRTDYINWDEYFMGIALLTAMRSKDPSSQVGACIVSPENKILSLGYNGMPIGCDDDAMPWEREGEPLNTDYINWDEYFMGIALLTAMRSKDPSSQVGACIVSPENKILSLGYNGMPIGCDDDAMPWEREGEPLNTKYMYVCHAELNAILNSAHNNLKGARVYVTLFPCNECTKAIIQSGIAEVVYYSDKYHDTDSSVAARFMFQKAGVRLTPYQPSGRKAELEL